MFNKEKLREISKNNKSNWLENAKWRQENQNWIDISSKIALKVLLQLRELNIEPKDFLNNLKIENKENILKGNRNFTLKEIAEIEDNIGIKLIEIK